MNRRSFFGAVVGGALAACGVKSQGVVRDVLIQCSIERSAVEQYPDCIVIKATPIKFATGMKLRAVGMDEVRQWRDCSKCMKYKVVS